MLGVTAEARFADLLELALYNGVLSSISLDGKEFFYTNPLRRVDELPFELRWSRKREPYISCFCCPPNVLRTIAEVAGYASHEEFIIHVLEKELAQFEDAGSDEEIVEKLKGLGYIS